MPLCEMQLPLSQQRCHQNRTFDDKENVVPPGRANTAAKQKGLTSLPSSQCALGPVTARRRQDAEPLKPAQVQIFDETPHHREGGDAFNFDVEHTPEAKTSTMWPKDLPVKNTFVHYDDLSPKQAAARRVPKTEPRDYKPEPFALAPFTPVVISLQAAVPSPKTSQTTNPSNRSSSTVVQLSLSEMLPSQSSEPARDVPVLSISDHLPPEPVRQCGCAPSATRNTLDLDELLPRRLTFAGGSP